jgi:hypothetical protein
MKKKQRKLDLQPRLPHEVSTAVATSQESPPCMPLSDKVKLPVVPNIIAKDNYGLLAKSLPVGNSGHKSSSQEEATPTLGVPQVLFSLSQAAPSPVLSVPDAGSNSLHPDGAELVNYS